MTIPPFTEFGLLPPGVHVTTLEAVDLRFGGDTAVSMRRQLARNLRLLLEEVTRFRLFRAAIVGGSFITDRIDPADIDVGLEFAAHFDIHQFNEFFRDFDHDDIKSRLLLDCYPFVSPGRHDFRQFFQYVRDDWAVLRGVPTGTQKGVLEVPL